MDKVKLRGLNPQTKDERDFQLGALIKWPGLKDLPDNYELKPLSIKDQLADGNDDFCASCAGSGMIEPKEEAELFYPFLFAAAKYLSGDDPDSFGLELRQIGKALVKYGVPEMKDVPEEIKNLSPFQRRRFENYQKYPILFESAKKHQAKTFFFINGPYDPYDNARAAQWYFRKQKQNIMFGVVWGWDLSQYILEGFPEGFGHALWINGWSENGIRVVNSAGKSAGVDGCHKITRAVFNKYASQFGLMMVVDLSREEAEYRINNNLRIDQNWLVALAKVLQKLLAELFIFAKH